MILVSISVFYSASGLCSFSNEDFVISRFCSIHFTCNFGRAKEYCSIYRGPRNIEVRYCIEVPLYNEPPI